ncbi:MULTISPECIES: caspase family protein [Sphingomonas]|uniref:caspase family protein n=1 Tax=Sphingomonas TaxID=13687 RepID=UPI0009EBCF68|nr:caspase family protein [Sphingomonas sp. CCH10-B3]
MDRLANASANASAWPSFLRWLRATGLAALLLLVPEAAIAGKRLALVIGITQYRSVPSLANPARDAAKVAQALRSVNFEVTELTQSSQVNRTELLTAITAFKRAAVGAEAAIIYYAGHGVQVGAKNWLLPSDVQAETPDEIEASAVASSYLINAVSGATKVRLVILDACRDNPFADTPGWSSGGRSLDKTRGLVRETNLPPSVVVLLATQPGAKASDGAGASNSPFALALASVIPTEGLPIGFLPSAVLRAMKRMTGIDQRPDAAGIFDEESWAFRPGSGAAIAVRPTPSVTEVPGAIPGGAGVANVSGDAADGFGLVLVPRPDGKPGVLVSRVSATSPFFGKVYPNDAILKLNGVPPQGPSSIVDALTQDNRASVLIERNGNPISRTLEIQKRIDE